MPPKLARKSVRGTTAGGGLAVEVTFRTQSPSDQIRLTEEALGTAQMQFATAIAISEADERSSGVVLNIIEVPEDACFEFFTQGADELLPTFLVADETGSGKDKRIVNILYVIGNSCNISTYTTDASLYGGDGSVGVTPITQSAALSLVYSQVCSMLQDLESANKTVRDPMFNHLDDLRRVGSEVLGLFRHIQRHEELTATKFQEKVSKVSSPIDFTTGSYRSFIARHGLRSIFAPGSRAPLTQDLFSLYDEIKGAAEVLEDLSDRKNFPKVDFEDVEAYFAIVGGLRTHFTSSGILLADSKETSVSKATLAVLQASTLGTSLLESLYEVYLFISEVITQLDGQMAKDPSSQITMRQRTITSLFRAGKSEADVIAAIHAMDALTSSVVTASGVVPAAPVAVPVPVPAAPTIVSLPIAIAAPVVQLNYTIEQIETLFGGLRTKYAAIALNPDRKVPHDFRRLEHHKEYLDYAHRLETVSESYNYLRFFKLVPGTSLNTMHYEVICQKIDDIQRRAGEVSWLTQLTAAITEGLAKLGRVGGGPGTVNHELFVSHPLRGLNDGMIPGVAYNPSLPSDDTGFQYRFDIMIDLGLDVISPYLLSNGFKSLAHGTMWRIGELYVRKCCGYTHDPMTKITCVNQPQMSLNIEPFVQHFEIRRKVVSFLRSTVADSMKGVKASTALVTSPVIFFNQVREITIGDATTYSAALLGDLVAYSIKGVDTKQYILEVNELYNSLIRAGGQASYTWKMLLDKFRENMSRGCGTTHLIFETNRLKLEMQLFNVAIVEKGYTTAEIETLSQTLLREWENTYSKAEDDLARTVALQQSHRREPVAAPRKERLPKPEPKRDNRHKAWLTTTPATVTAKPTPVSILKEPFRPPPQPHLPTYTHRRDTRETSGGGGLRGRGGGYRGGRGVSSRGAGRGGSRSSHDSRDRGRGGDTPRSDHSRSPELRRTSDYRSRETNPSRYISGSVRDRGKSNERGKSVTFERDSSRSRDPLSKPRLLESDADCFGCGAKGHFARNCPNPSQRGRSTTKPVARQSAFHTSSHDVGSDSRGYKYGGDRGAGKAPRVDFYDEVSEHAYVVIDRPLTKPVWRPAIQSQSESYVMDIFEKLPMAKEVMISTRRLGVLKDVKEQAAIVAGIHFKYGVAEDTRDYAVVKEQQAIKVTLCRFILTRLTKSHGKHYPSRQWQNLVNNVIVKSNPTFHTEETFDSNKWPAVDILGADMWLKRANQGLTRKAVCHEVRLLGGMRISNPQMWETFSRTSSLASMRENIGGYWEYFHFQMKLPLFRVIDKPLSSDTISEEANVAFRPEGHEIHDDSTTIAISSGGAEQIRPLHYLRHSFDEHFRHHVDEGDFTFEDLILHQGEMQRVFTEINALFSNISDTVQLIQVQLLRSTIHYQELMSVPYYTGLDFIQYKESFHAIHRELLTDPRRLHHCLTRMRPSYVELWKRDKLQVWLKNHTLVQSFRKLFIKFRVEKQYDNRELVVSRLKQCLVEMVRTHVIFTERHEEYVDNYHARVLRGTTHLAIWNARMTRLDELCQWEKYDPDNLTKHQKEFVKLLVDAPDQKNWLGNYLERVQRMCMLDSEAHRLQAHIGMLLHPDLMSRVASRRNRLKANHGRMYPPPQPDAVEREFYEAKINFIAVKRELLNTVAKTFSAPRLRVVRYAHPKYPSLNLPLSEGHSWDAPTRRLAHHSSKDKHFMWFVDSGTRARLSRLSPWGRTLHEINARTSSSVPRTGCQAYTLRHRAMRDELTSRFKHSFAPDSSHDVPPSLPLRSRRERRRRAKILGRVYGKLYTSSYDGPLYDESLGHQVNQYMAMEESQQKLLRRKGIPPVEWDALNEVFVNQLVNELPHYAPPVEEDSDYDSDDALEPTLLVGLPLGTLEDLPTAILENLLRPKAMVVIPPHPSVVELVVEEEDESSLPSLVPHVVSDDDDGSLPGLDPNTGSDDDDSSIPSCYHSDDSGDSDDEDHAPRPISQTATLEALTPAALERLRSEHASVATDPHVLPHLESAVASDDDSSSSSMPALYYSDDSEDEDRAPEPLTAPEMVRRVFPDMSYDAYEAVIQRQRLFEIEVAASPALLARVSAYRPAMVREPPLVVAPRPSTSSVPVMASARPPFARIQLRGRRRTDATSSRSAPLPSIPGVTYADDVMRGRRQLGAAPFDLRFCLHVPCNLSAGHARQLAERTDPAQRGYRRFMLNMRRINPIHLGLNPKLHTLHCTPSTSRSYVEVAQWARLLAYEAELIAMGYALSPMWYCQAIIRLHDFVGWFQLNKPACYADREEIRFESDTDDDDESEEVGIGFSDSEEDFDDSSSSDDDDVDIVDDLTAPLQQPWTLTDWTNHVKGHSINPPVYNDGTKSSISHDMERHALIQRYNQKNPGKRSICTCNYDKGEDLPYFDASDDWYRNHFVSADRYVSYSIEREDGVPDETRCSKPPDSIFGRNWTYLPNITGRVENRPRYTPEQFFFALQLQETYRKRLLTRIELLNRKPFLKTRHPFNGEDARRTASGAIHEVVNMVKYHDPDLRARTPGQETNVYIDSCATSSFLCNKDFFVAMFTAVTPVEVDGAVKVASDGTEGKSIATDTWGVARLVLPLETTDFAGRVRTSLATCLVKAWYAPGLSRNLLSQTQFMKAGVDLNYCAATMGGSALAWKSPDGDLLDEPILLFHINVESSLTMVDCLPPSEWPEELRQPLPHQPSRMVRNKSVLMSIPNTPVRLTGPSVHDQIRYRRRTAGSHRGREFIFLANSAVSTSNFPIDRHIRSIKEYLTPSDPTSVLDCYKDWQEREAYHYHGHLLLSIHEYSIVAHMARQISTIIAANKDHPYLRLIAPSDPHDIALSMWHSYKSANESSEGVANIVHETVPRIGLIGDIDPIRKEDLEANGVNEESTVENAFLTTMETKDIVHDLLGHPSDAVVEKMLAKDSGYKFDFNAWTSNPCPTCKAGKCTLKHFKTRRYESGRAPMERLHTDSCGPITAGNAYVGWSIIVDGYSGYSRATPLEDKTAEETWRIVELFINWGERQTERRVKHIRLDGGTEFKKQLVAYAEKKGIELEITTPYTSQQNGTAERMNRTIATVANVLLFSSQLPRRFWHHAVMHACYLINRKIRKYKRQGMEKAVDITPYELFFGVKPDLKALRPFGCPAIIVLPKEQRKANSKLDLSKSTMTGVFVGITEIHPTKWKVLVPQKNNHWKLYESSHVTVDVHIAHGYDYVSRSSKLPVASRDELLREDTDLFADSLPAFSNTARHTDMVEVPAPTDMTSDEGEADVVAPSTSTGDSEVYPEEHDDIDLSDFEPPAIKPTLPRRSPRLSQQVFLTKEIEEDEVAASKLPVAPSPHLLDDLVEPRKYSDIFKCSKDIQDKWLESVMSEWNSLNKLGTWEVVRLPKGKHTVGNKWVFKIKRNPDNSIAKFKSRVVAKGYTQIYGDNYTDTYAPVARINSIFIFVSFLLRKGIICHQYDVETAYLNGFLKEELYMDMPEGFKEYDADGTPLVCRLIKGLYGLKQAGKVWNDAISEKLYELGFTSLSSDTCVFIHKSDMGIVWVLLYVDDLIIAATDDKLRVDLLSKLNAVFTLIYQGVLNWFLGITFKYSADYKQIAIHQQGFADKIVHRFSGYLHKEKNGLVKNCVTPMSNTTRLTKADCPDPEHIPATLRDFPMRSVTGSLQYLLHTRNDIKFAVNQLCRFTANPGNTHVDAAKRILTYLACNKNLGLVFGRGFGHIMEFVKNSKGEPLFTEVPQGLVLFCDSDWGADIDTRKSVRGFALFYYGDLLICTSRIDTTVSTSSAAGEISTIVLGSQHAIWTLLMLNELGDEHPQPILVVEDNSAAIAMSYNPNAFAAKTKSLAIKKHHVHDLVARGLIAMIQVGTKYQLGDSLTKAADKSTFLTHRPFLNHDVTHVIELKDEVKVEEVYMTTHRVVHALEDFPPCLACDARGHKILTCLYLKVKLGAAIANCIMHPRRDLIASKTLCPCGTQGHAIFQCHYYNMKVSNAKDSTAPKPKDPKAVRCYTCDDVGHYARDCLYNDAPRARAERRHSTYADSRKRTSARDMPSERSAAKHSTRIRSHDMPSAARHSTRLHTSLPSAYSRFDEQPTSELHLSPFDQKNLRRLSEAAIELEQRLNQSPVYGGSVKSRAIQHERELELRFHLHKLTLTVHSIVRDRPVIDYPVRDDDEPSRHSVFMITTRARKEDGDMKVEEAERDVEYSDRWTRTPADFLHRESFGESNDEYEMGPKDTERDRELYRFMDPSTRRFHWYSPEEKESRISRTREPSEGEVKLLPSPPPEPLAAAAAPRTFLKARRSLDSPMVPLSQSSVGLSSSSLGDAEARIERLAPLVYSTGTKKQRKELAILSNSVTTVSPRKKPRLPPAPPSPLQPDIMLPAFHKGLVSTAVEHFIPPLPETMTSSRELNVEREAGREAPLDADTRAFHLLDYMNSNQLGAMDMVHIIFGTSILSDDSAVPELLATLRDANLDLFPITTFAVNTFLVNSSPSEIHSSVAHTIVIPGLGQFPKQTRENTFASHDSPTKVQVLLNCIRNLARTELPSPADEKYVSPFDRFTIWKTTKGMIDMDCAMDRDPAKNFQRSTHSVETLDEELDGYQEHIDDGRILIYKIVHVHGAAHPPGVLDYSYEILKKAADVENSTKVLAILSSLAIHLHMPHLMFIKAISKCSDCYQESIHRACQQVVPERLTEAVLSLIKYHALLGELIHCYRVYLHYAPQQAINLQLQFFRTMTDNTLFPCHQLALTPADAPWRGMTAIRSTVTDMGWCTMDATIYHHVDPLKAGQTNTKLIPISFKMGYVKQVSSPYFPVHANPSLGSRHQAAVRQLLLRGWHLIDVVGKDDKGMSRSTYFAPQDRERIATVNYKHQETIQFTPDGAMFERLPSDVDNHLATLRRHLIRQLNHLRIIPALTPTIDPKRTTLRVLDASQPYVRHFVHGSEEYPSFASARTMRLADYFFWLKQTYCATPDDAGVLPEFYPPSRKSVIDSLEHDMRYLAPYAKSPSSATFSETSTCAEDLEYLRTSKDPPMPTREDKRPDDSTSALIGTDVYVSHVPLSPATYNQLVRITDEQRMEKYFDPPSPTTEGKALDDIIYHPWPNMGMPYQAWLMVPLIGKLTKNAKSLSVLCTYPLVPLVSVYKSGRQFISPVHPPRFPYMHSHRLRNILIINGLVSPHPSAPDDYSCVDSFPFVLSNEAYNLAMKSKAWDERLSEGTQHNPYLTTVDALREEAATAAWDPAVEDHGFTVHPRPITVESAMDACAISLYSALSDATTESLLDIYQHRLFDREDLGRFTMKIMQAFKIYSALLESTPPWALPYYKYLQNRLRYRMRSTGRHVHDGTGVISEFPLLEVFLVDNRERGRYQLATLEWSNEEFDPTTGIRRHLEAITVAGGADAVIQDWAYRPYFHSTRRPSLDHVISDLAAHPPPHISDSSLYRSSIEFPQSQNLNEDLDAHHHALVCAAREIETSLLGKVWLTLKALVIGEGKIILFAALLVFLCYYADTDDQFRYFDTAPALFHNYFFMRTAPFDYFSISHAQADAISIIDAALIKSSSDVGINVRHIIVTAIKELSLSNTHDLLRSIQVCRCSIADILLALFNFNVNCQEPIGLLMFFTIIVTPICICGIMLFCATRIIQVTQQCCRGHYLESIGAETSIDLYCKHHRIMEEATATRPTNAIGERPVVIIPSLEIEEEEDLIKTEDPIKTTPPPITKRDDRRMPSTEVRRIVRRNLDALEARELQRNQGAAK